MDLPEAKESRHGRASEVADFEPITLPKGRPRYRRKKIGKEAEKLSEQDGETTIRVDEEFSESIPRQRGRPPKQQPEKDEPKEQKISLTEASTVTDVVLMVCNSFAVSVAGPDAQIQPQERMPIQEGMRRSLSRCTPKQLERMGVILDPMMVLFGFGMWYHRVARLRPLNARKESVQQAAESSGIENAASQMPQETLVPNGADHGVQQDIVSSTPAPDRIQHVWGQEP